LTIRLLSDTLEGACTAFCAFKPPLKRTLKAGDTFGKGGYCGLKEKNAYKTETCTTLPLRMQNVRPWNALREAS
jgi:hypothetical protein